MLGLEQSIASTQIAATLRAQPSYDRSHMTIFVSIAFGLSLAVILLGFWADRSAISARINGANGLPILVALIASFLASLVVAVIAWLFDGFEMLVWVLLFSIPYHAGLGGLLIWRLQSLATRAKAADDANSQRIADMFRKPSKPQS
jgi:hypothetical protein